LLDGEPLFPMIHQLQKLVVFAALSGLVYWVWPAGELRQPPGVRVNREPVQETIPAIAWNVQGYNVTALASYQINARVLHTKKYWSDHNDLVPFDVALGWGAMSDQAVLDHLEVSQGNRFFFYEWQGEPPVPLKEIVCHASNNHVIAANSQVASTVKRLRAGQFVQMQGYLVNVTGPNGFHWNTSLTRTDDGNGACEVFYVNTITVTDDLATAAL
jgi:hypothetical protein